MLVFYPTACHYSSNIEQFVRITWVTAGRFVGSSVVFSGFSRIHHEYSIYGEEFVEFARSFYILPGHNQDGRGG